MDVGATAKHRMEGLDTLRGVAAIVVMLYHSAYTHFPIDHGYLAVDFFFILSGFVIAAAYEVKLRSDLGMAAFMASRLLRLYPILFIGAVLGVLAMSSIEQDGLLVPLHFSRSCAILTAFLLVPFVCGGLQSFILNLPYWSILYELVCNLLHGLLLPVLRTRVLLILVIVLAAGLVAAIDDVGLDVGWQRSHFVVAALRAGFDYFTGVLLFRTKPLWWDRLPRVPLSVLAILLFAALMVPSFPLHAHTRSRDLLTVFAVFPPIVALASKWDRDTLIARWSGTLSYPLYAIHLPCLGLASLLMGDADLSHRAFVAINIVTIGAMLVVALLIGLWIDRPINRWRRGLQQALSAGRR